jgi:hypothetical protein
MFAGFIALGIMEDLLWNQHLMRLPPEARDEAEKRRAAHREKSRLEAIDERRHKEMCAAIRSTVRDY